MVDWSSAIEARHTDGRVKAVKLLQKNAGVVPGNDHWCCTDDGARLDSTPGAISHFWVRDDGWVHSYAGWQVHNTSEGNPHG